MEDPIIKTKEIINNVQKFISSTPWAQEYTGRINNLLSELDKPCELAVVGRVKAGKSSFINALLGADLAKTGTTETTATINYFKYGVPEDPERPIKAVYSNSRETWVSKDFLDSLQDNTEEALNKAAGIKHLEFYLPDPRLEKITLVDTPGFDAIVGKDDQGHEKIADNYLLKSLRERHAKETEVLSSSADAVIYLVGEVANQTAQRILTEFTNSSGGFSSAMNAIGVISKIDLTDSIIEERFDLASSIAEKLQKELNTVVPVSAGIKRAWDQLEKSGSLHLMKSKLEMIPADRLNKMLQMEKTYLRPNIPDCPLDVEERTNLMANIPWRVFVVIARELRNKSIEEAKEILLDIAGMDKLNKLLEEHFFQRGRILRYNSTVYNLLLILKEIENNKLNKMKMYAEQKNEYFSLINEIIIDSLTKERIVKQLTDLIETSLPSSDSINIIENNINELINKTEELLLKLSETNNDFKALKLIEQTPEEFTDEERTELFILFGQYANQNISIDTKQIAMRQMYWKKEYNWAHGSVRKQVAKLAIEKYGII